MVNSPLNINNTLSARGVNFKVVIVNYFVDVTADVVDIDLNFSITGLSKGFFILNDIDNNIFNRYPLVSGEKIMINVASDFSSRTNMFKTYIISSVDILPKTIKIANSKNLYRVNLISTLLQINNLRQISRGFTETKTSSEIVQSILDVDFGLKDAGLYTIVQSITTLDNYIIPYKYPLDEIEYLKIISSDIIYDKDFYLFYEDYSLFNFVPISLLIQKKTKI